MFYEPRTMSSKVYQKLKTLKNQTPVSDQQEQKNQAVELYSYLSSWGLLRLKAEEFALQKKPNKQIVIKCFFETFSDIYCPDNPQRFQGIQGLEELSNLNQIGANNYLGLMGLALQLAREFAFWAEAVYPKDTP